MNRFASFAASFAVLCVKTSAETISKCEKDNTGCGPGCFLHFKNQLCESAPAGYYSPLGDNELYECRVGHFSRGRAEACTPCPAGRFVDIKGSDTCYLCGIATYSSESGSKKCESCNPALYVGYGSDAAETHVSGITFCIAPPKIGSPTGNPSTEPSNPATLSPPPTLYPTEILSGAPTGPLYNTLAPTLPATADPNTVNSSAEPSMTPTTMNEDPNGINGGSVEPSASPEPTVGTVEPKVTSPSNNITWTSEPTPFVPTPSPEPSRAPVPNISLEPSAFPTTTQSPTSFPSTIPSTGTPTSGPIFVDEEDDDASSVPLMQKLLWMVALPLFILSILICCCVWILLRCWGPTKKEKSVPGEGGALMLDEVSEIEDSEVYLENDTQMIDGMSEVEVDEGGSAEVWASY